MCRQPTGSALSTLKKGFLIMSSFSFSSALLGTAAMLVVVPAHAQAANARTDAAQGVGEIVVTAQKRAERLIDTPQSVTAVSTADLQKLGATQLVDFVNTVPGLQFATQGAGKSTVSLRGITTGNDVSQTVGIYVDEVPYGSSSAFVKGALLALDVGLFDLDRIEVLRGPQGTLYGASSMGGIFKYVTRAPSFAGFGGSAQAGISSTHAGGTSYNGAVSLNIPVVSDKIAVRAGGFYSRDGGYIDNVATGQKDVDRGKIYGGRVDGLLKPVDDLSIRITGFAQDIRRDGSRYSDYSFSGIPLNGPLAQSHPLNEPFKSNFRLVSATVNYDFGLATLVSSTSYQTSRNTFTQDLTGAYLAFLPLLGITGGQAVGYTEVDLTRKFTQELRLAAPSKSKLEWLLGAFYTREKSSSDQATSIYGAGLAVFPFKLSATTGPSTYEEYAFFGDLTWHLTDRFDVTGGVRYAHNSQLTEQTGSGLLDAPQPRRTSGEGVVTYLANARYHLSDLATAYVRFATGYRPGGPNPLARGIVSGQLLFAPSFKSDTLKSYEAGVKAETTDRKLSVNASVYHISWDNIQVVAAIEGRTGLVNSAGAHIDGAELALAARPSRGVTFTGAFAYNHSALTQADVNLGAAKGERLPNAPRYSATVNADYVYVNSKLRPSVGATLRYISDRTVSFNSNVGTPQYRLPDYAQVDLRAGVTVGPVDAQIFVRNLFDTRGQLSGLTYLSSLGAPAQVTVMQPRTIGASLTTKF